MPTWSPDVAKKKANRNTQPIGALVVPGAVRLVIVGGACPQGLTFSLADGTHAAGRTANGVVLKEDETVSPKHCSFSVDGGQIEVKDEGSLNGVYLRIRAPHTLSHGDWFRVGQQLFRFEELTAETEFTTDDGTHVFTSPRRKGSFRVCQILEGGKRGLSSTASDDEISIGGEGAHIAFSSDPNLSQEHCRLYRDANGAFMIEDLDSTNGTYVRIDGLSSIAHGDYLYVGHELLRVEVS